MRLKKYISVEKASQHSRFTPATLSEICASGFVEAKNIGRRWFISEADCEKRLASGEIADWASSLERFLKFRAALAVIIGLICLASLPNLNLSLPQPLPTFLQASLTDSVIELSDYWSQRLTLFWDALPDNWFFLKERVLANWQHFLGVAETPASSASEQAPVAPLSLSTSLDPAFAQAIEKYIEQQIAARLSTQIKGANVVTGPPSQPAAGLVAVPSTGDQSKDKEVHAWLEKVFSDRVTVRLDPSGTTGIVTPIFQDAPSSDYIFILTPLKQR